MKAVVAFLSTQARCQPAQDHSSSPRAACTTSCAGTTSSLRLTGESPLNTAALSRCDAHHPHTHTPRRSAGMHAYACGHFCHMHCRHVHWGNISHGSSHSPTGACMTRHIAHARMATSWYRQQCFCYSGGSNRTVPAPEPSVSVASVSLTWLASAPCWPGLSPRRRPACCGACRCASLGAVAGVRGVRRSGRMCVATSFAVLRSSGKGKLKHSS